MFWLKSIDNRTPVRQQQQRRRRRLQVVRRWRARARRREGRSQLLFAKNHCFKSCILMIIIIHLLNQSNVAVNCQQKTITQTPLFARHNNYFSKQPFDNLTTVQRAEQITIKTTNTANNNNNNKAQSLLLVQADGPDFTEPIGNHTVAVGRDAQLSCKISNLSNYRTAWLRVEDKGILTIHNNVITRNYRFGLLNNENEQNFVLTIKNVQPSDKGGYMCQINSVPMKYAIGYLDVLTPPIFVDDAAATGGGDVESSDYVTTTTTTVSSTAASDGAELVPQAAGQQASLAPNSSQTTVVEGASATLTCRASGHPSPSITWRREDGKPIMLNGLTAEADIAATSDIASLTEIKDTQTLNFKSVSRHNSAAYLCIASNGVQPSASKRQILDVQYSPIVTLPQVEIAAVLNQRESKLECLVELNPLGSYHWIKLATSTTNTDRRPMALNQEDDLWLIEHDELIQSDKFDIVIKQINSEKVHMILTIRNVEKHDFSWYKCIAKNSLGLQSNFIRFYESSAPANSLASLPSSTSSSSFSFNNIFRTSGSNNNLNSNSNQHQDYNKLNLPQNDESRHQSYNGGDNAAQQQQQQQGRAHLRSSWIQRSTGSTPSSSASSGSSSRAMPPSLCKLLALITHNYSKSTLLGLEKITTGIYLLLLTFTTYSSINNCLFAICAAACATAACTSIIIMNTASYLISTPAITALITINFLLLIRSAASVRLHT